MDYVTFFIDREWKSPGLDVSFVTITIKNRSPVIKKQAIITDNVQFYLTYENNDQNQANTNMRADIQTYKLHESKHLTIHDTLSSNFDIAIYP